VLGSEMKYPNKKNNRYVITAATIFTLSIMTASIMATAPAAATTTTTTITDGDNAPDDTNTAATTAPSGEEVRGEVPQLRPQLCGSSSSGDTSDDTNTDTTTTTGIASTNNNNNNTATSFPYQNPEYGIQILCPENWLYGEEVNPVNGDFQVYFILPVEVQRSQTTGETAPVISVAIRELPFADFNLELFSDLNIRDLTSTGHEIIRTGLNATLSGMPAFEVVYVDPNGTMFLQDWTIQNDRAYGVVYVSPEPRFNEFLPIAQDMISSFVITNDTSTTSLLTTPPRPSEEAPPMIDDTMTTNTTSTTVENNETTAPPKQGEGGVEEEQTTIAPNPLFE
jgi:hypothetical protein